MRILVFLVSYPFLIRHILRSTGGYINIKYTFNITTCINNTDLGGDNILL